jgi:hypothetical protein
MQSVLLGWQVYELTHDPLALGFVGLSEALPFLSTTLYGGHVADLKDRRTICLASLVALLLGALVLRGFSGSGLPAHLWPLYVVQMLAGLSRAFLRPAAQALGTELVPKELYANAAAWRSTNLQASLVAGPALGGLIYGFVNAHAAYTVEAICLFLSILALARLKPRPRPEAAAAGRRFLDGVRFVFRKQVVLGALSLDLFAVLFGGAPALLPIFAGAAFLDVGPKGLGLLRAAPAAGSVAMALILAHRPPLRRAGRTLLLCVAGFGLCWIAFAFSRAFWLSMLLLAMSGALDNVSVVLRSTLVQTLTPPELMGRVSAVNSFFIGSSNEVGAFESGVAAKLLGIVPSVVFGGCMTLATVGLTAWRAPMLRKLRSISSG